MALLIIPFQARADFWGGDLPLLTEIVFNTLHTMMELEKQTESMNDELAGIKDKIQRVQTIANLVQPSQWGQWKDPREAVQRLRTIYYNMPKEYRTEKYDTIDDEISKAMNLAARTGPEAKTSFDSGKELERRGADASPGVAQKLTASGVGSLVAIQSQSLVMESHITSLLAQMLAEGNERETRGVALRGDSMKAFSGSLRQDESKFSQIVLGLGASR